MADQTTGNSAEGRRERLRALREQRAARAGEASEASDAKEQTRGRGLRRRKAGAAPGGEKGGKLRALLADPQKREQIMERFPKLAERLLNQSEDAPERGGRQKAARGRLAGAGGRRAGAGVGMNRRVDAPGVKGREGRPEGGGGIVLGRKVKELQTQVGELSSELEETRKELQALQAAKPKVAAKPARRKPRARRATTTRTRAKKK